VHRRAYAISLCAAAVLLIAAPAQAGAWNLTLKAPGHHPTAGEPWPIKVGAHTRSGKPLRATAIYKFLFNGVVVGTSSPYGRRSTKPYPFKGSFRDTLRWPKKAVGYRLTFRVVVKARHVNHRRKHVDYWVRVRP